MIVFRHADPRFAFIWESPEQPAGRWNVAGGAPVQYFADTPDGAWAEFLRHEGIDTESDLENVRRALWAVELPDDLRLETPDLAPEVLKGGLDTYECCQAEASRLRARASQGLRAPSAALIDGGARGWQVDAGLQPGPARDGFVFALFQISAEAVGWAATIAGRPQKNLLARVRPLS